MSRNEGTAFTLIELLVVIAIIGLLAAMLLPVLSRAREQSRRAACTSNVRQIMLAMTMYADDYGGRLPAQRVGGSGTLDWSGLLSNRVKNVKMFWCPSDRNRRNYAGTPRSYAVNSGKWTFTGSGYQSPWPRGGGDPPGTTTIPGPPARIGSVPAQVFLVGENHGNGDPNGGVVGIAENEGLDALAASQHSRGGNYGFSDGRVEYWLKSKADVYRADTDYGGDTNDPWKWK